ncbi:hypothetical protein D3C81_2315700 [compost metagenome]
MKALAKKAGLRIIDANVTESRDGECEKSPKAKLKAEYREVSQSTASTADKAAQASE